MVISLGQGASVCRDRTVGSWPRLGSSVIQIIINNNSGCRALAARPGVLDTLIFQIPAAGVFPRPYSVLSLQLHAP